MLEAYVCEWNRQAHVHMQDLFWKKKRKKKNRRATVMTWSTTERKLYCEINPVSSVFWILFENKDNRLDLKITTARPFLSVHRYRFIVFLVVVHLFLKITVISISLHPFKLNNWCMQSYISHVSLETVWQCDCLSIVKLYSYFELKLSKRKHKSI